MLRIIFSRLYREKVTIDKMIHIFCEKNHSRNTQLCLDCRELLEYAHRRLDYCPFSEQKPACNKCNIHCYKNDMRERIRLVMRFSGPKMLFKHPLLALLHLYDRRKEPPEIKDSRNRTGTKKINGILKSAPMKTMGKIS